MIPTRPLCTLSVLLFLVPSFIPQCSFLLEMSQLSLPPQTGYDSGNPVDYNSVANGDLFSPKFPHTRAQLSAIARQHKPLDNYDGDAELDDSNRIPPAFLNQIVALLVDEREDELKILLKQTYPMDDESVSYFPSSYQR